MTTNRPTLINLPPAPSDPGTPNDLPGTPNSATTTMSELSTVAIKDGHRGHFPHHHHPADAERADRISRLAGLERVAVTGRTPHGLAPGAASNPPPGYFDANQPQIFRERSTVGSASATGSVGGRTTWASGSDVNDPDRMSEDQDDERGDTGSIGGFSDEAVSLVGFGEGARTPARQHSQIGSPAIGKASAVQQHLREQQSGGPMTGVTVPSNSGATSSTEQHKQDSRIIDGMCYDEAVVDTTNRTPPLTGQGPGRSSTAEQVIRERMGQRQRQPGQAGASGQDAMEIEPQREN